MKKQRLFLDTNIVVDYINQREPYYESARVLMIAGFAGEFELWISASQVTDLIYILSDGERPSLLPRTLEQLRDARAFLNIHAVTEHEIDRMLQTYWKDPEDALLYECALDLRCDAIITRNSCGIESDMIPVFNCDEYLAYLKETYGVSYGVIEDF